MYAFASFVAGLVLGIGLIVSEMYSPVKVLALLDVAGNWDPSLAVTIACAIVVAAIAFAVARIRNRTLLGAELHLPPARGIDARLVLGSLAFGAGWGLAGFCPGPALVALGTGHVKAFIFVVAMIAGMAIYEYAESKRAQKSARAVHKPHAAEHEHAGARHRARKRH